MRMMTSSKLTWETKNNKICDETAALKYIDIEFILYNICQSFQVLIMSASGLCVCRSLSPYSVHYQLHCTMEGWMEEHEQYILYKETVSNIFFLS